VGEKFQGPLELLPHYLGSPASHYDHTLT